MRLLQDLTDRKVYELPDFEGNSDHDVLLHDLLARIRQQDPRWERDGIPHQGNLMKIDDDVWGKRKKSILSKMWEGFPGMDEEEALLSVRNTYVEDAGKCFNKHNRPSMGCIDFYESRKRIGSPVGNKVLAILQPVYLCDFCPVKTWVNTQERFAEGLYKEN